MTFNGEIILDDSWEDKQEKTTCCSCLKVFLRLFKKRKAAAGKKHLSKNDAQKDDENVDLEEDVKEENATETRVIIETHQEEEAKAIADVSDGNIDMDEQMIDEEEATVEAEE